MKRICIFLVLLNLAVIKSDYKNIPTRESNDTCTPDAFMTDNFIGRVITVSDCVDRQLTTQNGQLYDKCCYIRAMTNGKVREGCFGLTREQTMDVPGYIPILEDRIKQRMIDHPVIPALFDVEITEGTKVKVYSLDCEASYIKYFASVLALSTLLF